MGKPSFIITIDTEPDDLWSKRSAETRENLRFIPRFQRLCEEHGFKPVYLADYSVARDEMFRSFGREVLRRGTAEIGMHLHAWATPPHEKGDPTERTAQPYLVEYVEDRIRRKVAEVSGVLRGAFDSVIVSHRAGRWALDERYVRILAGDGYLVDCSITPGIALKSSGEGSLWRPRGYLNFPSRAYFLARDDIRKEGDSGILEVPMTIRTGPSRLVAAANSLHPRLARLLFSPRWFRPDGSNLDSLLSIAREAIETKAAYVEFMLHSSELMPGGSPNFPDAESIEKLYADLRCLFGFMRDLFEGRTLSEYRGRHLALMEDKS